MKKKYFYYHEHQKDDFGGVGVNNIPLKEDYEYINKNKVYKIFSWILYYLVAAPILYIYCKISLGVKVIGKENLKELKKDEGFFAYGNHCHYADAFMGQIFIGFPKKTYIVSHSDPINIPIVGKIVKLLGCIPLPNNLKTYKNYLLTLKELSKKNAIVIYPEATLWPYYNKLRPYEKTAFKYAAMNKRPIIIFSETFKNRKFLKPKIILTISKVIRPIENFSIDENTQYFYEKSFEFLKKQVNSKENTCFHKYEKIQDVQN